jgi:hypothetical protein
LRQNRATALDATQLVGGALGGALASSVLGPLIAQRRERRDLRAAVLRAIADVERTKWAPTGRKEFRAAVVACRAPRSWPAADCELAGRYLFLAEVAQRASETSAEELEIEDGGGAIPGELADLVTEVAHMFVNHLWHPYRTRARLGGQLRRLARREDEVKAEIRDRGPPVDWTQRLPL